MQGTGAKTQSFFALCTKVHHRSMRTLQCKNYIKDEKENFSLSINVYVIEVSKIFLMQEFDRYSFPNFKLLQIRNTNKAK